MLEANKDQRVTLGKRTFTITLMGFPDIRLVEQVEHKFHRIQV